LVEEIEGLTPLYAAPELLNLHQAKEKAYREGK
jgi:hypothetical protein